jgi:thioredoxin reductase (NADPH)
MSDLAPSPEILRTDVVIIGAGPVGLFAVFECGMLKLSCHVVDALDAIGGQCVALYPEKPIFDIPGFPKIEAAALIEQLAEQAAPFEPRYHLGQQVIRLEPHEGGWLVETSKGTTIACRAVIVAGGSGAFGPNRPPLDGLEHYENRSVFYLVKRRQDFADKRVVIAGGGDSAVDWAVSLAEIAANVMVVHRRDKFRAAPESVSRMRSLVNDGKIEMIVPTAGCPVSRSRPWMAKSACWGPMLCWRSSDWRWSWGRSPNGASISPGSISGSIRRPWRPTDRAFSPSAISRPIPAS